MPKEASQNDIQKAYRTRQKAASRPQSRQHKAEEPFKEVSADYDVVGDPAKRARFHRGEIDASGAETPKREYYRGYAGSGAHRLPDDARASLSVLATQLKRAQGRLLTSRS